MENLTGGATSKITKNKNLGLKEKLVLAQGEKELNKAKGKVAENIDSGLSKVESSK